MRITIMPKTHLGWWAVGLFATSILLDVLHQTIASLVRRNPVINPSPPSPIIVVALFAGYGIGIVAFITGLISITRSKERSILVFLVVLVGFLALLFLFGELLFPH